MYRVYLAAQYARRNEMRDIATQLVERGFVVSSSWLDEEYPLDTKPNQLSDDENRDTALKDLEDLTGSDIIIFFSEDLESQPSRGGKHFELGFAHALGINIFIVGGAENLFHYLPDLKVIPNMEALWQIL